MKLFSPAKLNLFFRVLKKREDGFHEVASLMQALSFGDTLHFSWSKEDQITSTDPNLPLDERNFVHQARTLFRKKTGIAWPLSIHIEKQIPIEGGLGGGSSNLATTLWAMNQMAEAQIETQTLQEWAGELSSDAPFFFSSGTAYVTGRGEKVASLTPLPAKEVTLAKPIGEGLSTPLIYRHCAPDPIGDPKKILEGELPPRNDLELPAFNLRSRLKKLKEELLSLGYDEVRMTGSGTTFFCFGAVERPALSGVNFWKTSFLERTPEW
ncbi:MAG: 4-(cytidine 5'-diphospho)-2-C-methyl-D-erythritol kinase, partial [Chlamydiia bacterium]|nr:4-(cytidine 5'-diphospho)-2-C-methyl-D-erythritol kinase [Chlamydiia bacterium]